MAAQHARVLHRLLHLGCKQFYAFGLREGTSGLPASSATATGQQLLLHSKLNLQQGSRRGCSTKAARSNGDPVSEQQISSGVFQQQCRVAGKLWTFETGRLAKFAHGSCVVSVGGTSVLATAVVDPTPQLEADGVPLQVEYKERLSAVGRLPMRPDRRERNGTERELLAGRIIDRAIRPLLPPGFLYDTQVWCQVLSAGGAVQPEIVAINAASAALLLAPDIPYTYPIGAVRGVNKRGMIYFNWRLSTEEHPAVQLKLTYAGTPVKATAIEAVASQVSEKVFMQTLRFAAKATQPLIQAQLQLAATVASAQSSSDSSCSGATSSADLTKLQQHQRQYNLGLIWPSQQLQQTVEQLSKQPLLNLFRQQQQGPLRPNSSHSSNKLQRAQQLTQIQLELLSDLRTIGLLADDQTTVNTTAGGMYSKADVLRAFDTWQSKVMRQVLLEGGVRVDGRQITEVRPINCEVGMLPRCVHGSALFSRGETQSLATATVGHDRDVGQVESIFTPVNSSPNSGNNSSSSSPLLLHYSFPPFSVGELGKAGAPNRREIGHGNLARSGLLGILPTQQDFPFTVRVTADTLGSSGSSSMAAVCAGSLALQAAGVPIQGLAAGISVGLVTEHSPQLQCTAHWPDHVQQEQQGQQQVDQAASADIKGSSSGASSSSSDTLAANVDYSRVVSRGKVRQEQATTPVVEDVTTSEAPKSSSDSDAEADASSTSSANALLSSSYGSAVLLADIQGIEDHHGDMDFKVAGTADGITAVQLDTKLPGVDLHLLEAALKAAVPPRQQLLSKMSAAVEQYERNLPAAEAPEYGSVQIMKDLVPRLIGPQGATLLQIEETCGATLLVDDTGDITVYAPTQQQYVQALAAVQEVEGRGVQAGDVYNVKVLRVVDFGAYVSLPNGLPALLHVSEISHTKIREVREVLKEGDEFEVVCKGRDPKGFVRLSRKDLLPHPETGEVAARAVSEAADPNKGNKKEVPRYDAWQPPS